MQVDWSKGNENLAIRKLNKCWRRIKDCHNSNLLKYFWVVIITILSNHIKPVNHVSGFYIQSNRAKEMSSIRSFIKDIIVSFTILNWRFKRVYLFVSTKRKDVTHSSYNMCFLKTKKMIHNNNDIKSPNKCMEHIS